MSIRNLIVAAGVVVSGPTPWDLGNVTYSGKNVAITGNGDLLFSPDGSKMYLQVSSGTIRQYTLSTAWDVSTATYSTAYTGVSESSAGSLSASSDGTKMYVVGAGTGNPVMTQVNLSSAWDVSTGSLPGKTKIVAGAAANAFSSDGLTVFSLQAATIYKATLSTAWDISTAGSLSSAYNASAQETGMHGITFNSDGTKMFLAGATGDKVYQYALSTAWNVATASFSKSFSIATQETSVRGVAFSSDGLKMYIVGLGNKVFQYTIG